MNLPIKELGSIVEVRNGRDYKHVQNDNGKYPVYGSGGLMTYADEYICPEDTIIIGRKGTIDNPILVHEKFWNVDTAFGMICNQNILNPVYFYWFCKNYDFKQHNKATTLPSLTKQDIHKIKLMVPDKGKQDTFAEFVGQIDSLKTIYKQTFEAFDTLIKSRFNEMFGDVITNSKGWNHGPLSSYSEVSSSRRVFSEDFIEEGVPFYRGSEISELSETGKTVPKYYISLELYQELIKSSGKPEIGDILLPSICSKGELWIVDTDEPFYIKDGRVLWIKVNQTELNSIFLKYVLRLYIKNNFESIASGSTFSEMKIFLLKKIPVVVPPIELQNEFVEFTKQVDKSKFIWTISSTGTTVMVSKTLYFNKRRLLHTVPIQCLNISN